MEKIDRRSALALGLTAGSLLLAGKSRPAAAEGEAMPLPEGITMELLFEGPTDLPGYSMLRLEDYAFQPGAAFPEDPMPNAMLCHMVEGEVEVVLNGEKFTAKQNDVFTCTLGATESDANVSGSVAVMRVMNLLA